MKHTRTKEHLSEKSDENRAGPEKPSLQRPAPIQHVVGPFQEFVHAESSGGILLLAATAVALIWANSPWANTYHEIWQTPISLVVGQHVLRETALEWINDGLMAMFFFVIGLEIKREILVGELASIRQAAFPLGAAVGGTIVPATLYLAFNAGAPGAPGWGIPMATDIAFALGVLGLLGARVPVSLKVFLAALAIGDDLMAVVVIAIFYTTTISWLSLGVGAFFLILLIGANVLGIRHVLVYCLLGIGGLWLAFLLSGVHATIAGVLAAMTIPARPKLSRGEFLARGLALLRRFEQVTVPDSSPLANQEQHEVAHRLETAVKNVATPLQRLEQALHPWVTVVVMPIFALANAGVTLDAGFAATLVNPVAFGVLIGLLIGKPAGVLLGAGAVILSGTARMPESVTWVHLIGVGFLAGIGFTMSLFITDLAFGQAEAATSAKIGILLGSASAGLIGWAVLRRVRLSH
ncbi:MAG: Na+/H+ antiporter NhaA [Nitrospira sp.]|nr:Na+/H+ antiporter NhaA [Nitrospira sp.]